MWKGERINVNKVLKKRLRSATNLDLPAYTMTYPQTIIKIEN